MMSKLDEVRKQIKGLSAYALADTADCGTPDNSGSAGARFLLSVQMEVLDQYDPEGDLVDIAHAIAGEAPSIWYSEKWAQFVDLRAWQEDIDNDLGGTAGNDMNKQADICLYQIAYRLAEALLTELSEANDEDEEENA